MSWLPVNKKHKHLEDTRRACMVYIMGDLAGDLELKYRGYCRLAELKELPQMPARKLPNEGKFGMWPIVGFVKILNAIATFDDIIANIKKMKS